MPIVKMPDGAQVRFPDDMPREEIKRIIATKFPEVAQGQQQASSQGQDPANPTISVGGRQIPIAEYRAMSDEQRQGIQQQIGEQNPSASMRPTPRMPDTGFGGGISAFGQGVVEGLPVVGPLVERAGEAGGALMSSMLSGENYDQALSANRQFREGAMEGNQPERVAGNVAGAVGPFIGAGMTKAGQTMMGMTGPLLQRIGLSGVSGGTIAGADSAARGNSLPQVRDDALLGAGVGAAIPGVGAGVGALARGAGRTYNVLRGSAGNVEDIASSRVAAARQTDQASPQNMISQADEASAGINNQSLMNVDRGGETTLALMRAAANQNPNARAALTSAASDRFGMQSQRTTDFFNRIMGGNVSNLERTAQIQAQARAVNSPAYRQAFNDPAAQMVWNRDLQGLLQSDAIQSAIRQVGVRGSNRAAADGVMPIRNPFREGSDGRYRIVQDASGQMVAPNLAFWDQVKRNLDGMIGTAKRGGDDELVGDLMGLKRKLTGTLDGLVPSYGQARSGAMSFFNAEDAVSAGRNAWTAPKAIDESLAAFKKLSQADRDDFGIGMVSQIMDDVRSVNNRSNLMRFFDTPARRQLLNEALGPRKAKEMEAFVRVEDIMDRARGALGNSTTARQLAEMGLTGAAGAGGAMALGVDPFQAGGVGLMMAAGRSGYRALSKKADEQVLQRVAEMLISRDPAVVNRAIANAMLSQKHMQALEAIQRGIGSVARGSAVMAMQ